MDLLETLGGPDWIKLVMRASRVKQWKRVEKYRRLHGGVYVQEFASIYYEKSGIDYRVLIRRAYVECPKDVMLTVPVRTRRGYRYFPTLDVTRYTRLSIRNIMSGNYDFRNPPRRSGIDPGPDEICAMVEQLTGLSLNPF
jgi:hypothetical protein